MIVPKWIAGLPSSSEGDTAPSIDYRLQSSLHPQSPASGSRPIYSQKKKKQKPRTHAHAILFIAQLCFLSFFLHVWDSEKQTRESKIWETHTSCLTFTTEPLECTLETKISLKNQKTKYFACLSRGMTWECAVNRHPIVANDGQSGRRECIRMATSWTVYWSSKLMSWPPRLVYGAHHHHTPHTYKLTSVEKSSSLTVRLQPVSKTCNCTRLQ